MTLTFSEPVRLTAQRDHRLRRRRPDRSTSDDDRVGRPRSSSPCPAATSWPTAPTSSAGTCVSADGHPISGSLTFSIGERSDEVAAPPAAPESSRSGRRRAGRPARASPTSGCSWPPGWPPSWPWCSRGWFGGERVRGPDPAPSCGSRRSPPSSVACCWCRVASRLRAGPRAGRPARPASTRPWSPTRCSSALLLVFGLGVVVVLLTDAAPGPHRGPALLVAAGRRGRLPGRRRPHPRLPARVRCSSAPTPLHLARRRRLAGRAGRARPHPAGARRPGAGRRRDPDPVLARSPAACCSPSRSPGRSRPGGSSASWSAFVDTTYGRLLLVKIGIALVVVAVGRLEPVPAAAPGPRRCGVRRPRGRRRAGPAHGRGRGGVCWSPSSA